MPRFDYQCNNCSTEFEYFIVRSDDHPHCPNCASTNLRKKVSLVAIGNSNVKAPAQTPSLKSQPSAGHVCTSACNHGPKSHKNNHPSPTSIARSKESTNNLKKKYGF